MLHVALDCKNVMLSMSDVVKPISIFSCPWSSCIAQTHGVAHASHHHLSPV